MLGRKERTFKEHSALSLEQLVPHDNFYRTLEAKLDLRFVYDLVKPCYSSAMGRPSIDPMVFFKLQLIMFFEGMRSERQLMEQVSLNLAHRWYIGYDLDETVPDHSSLSKIRDRYGLVVFQRFFEQIVEMCQEAGLVWGKELYFDGSQIRANASVNSNVPRWYYEAKQHLQILFAETETLTSIASSDAGSAPAEQPKPVLARLVEKYDGTRLPCVRGRSYKRVTDWLVNPTDPSASPMNKGGGRVKLGYHTHYVVDGGRARIILAALVTPASITDNLPMLDLVRWVRFRWKIHPRIGVGDSKYGTTDNIVGLEGDGMRAYLPTPDYRGRTGLYPPPLFQYDAAQDLFVCPQGHERPLSHHSYPDEHVVYKADATTCNCCPVKSLCTTSNSGRSLQRSFHQEILDRAASYRESEAFKKALRKRQVWVEPLFGEGKQWHQMARFRMRGLIKVNIEGLMKAAGQNIKRLLKASAWQKPLNPGGGAMQIPSFCPH